MDKRGGRGEERQGKGWGGEREREGKEEVSETRGEGRVEQLSESGLEQFHERFLV